ncbi:hypothetical protein ACTL6U_12035 [Rhodovibrionaceae bacterium A322]
MLRVSGHTYANKIFWGDLSLKKSGQLWDADSLVSRPTQARVGVMAALSACHWEKVAVAMLMQQVRAEQFFDALEPDVRSSLSENQVEGIRDAYKRTAWRSHPVDIRLSVPFFGRGFYFTLVAGPERRSSARVRQERSKHPLATLNNAFFIGLVSLGSIGALALLIAFLTGALEL